MRNKYMLAAAMTFSALLALYSMNAGASPGQTYNSDGTVGNPSGGWTILPPYDARCFFCHVGSAIAPDKRSYLSTGHKNSLRKVLTLPAPLTGPSGAAYTEDQSGNLFNWSANEITVNSISEPLYYILNGWMGSQPKPSALYDGSYPAGFPCARCHTTGFKMETSVNASFPPESTFPGITSTINFDPDGDGPAASSSWALGHSNAGAGESPASLDGVQCERCHNYGFHTNGAALRGQSATTLCLQCHRQEHILPYGGGGLGSNIKPTPSSDNIPLLTASEPVYALPQIEVGTDAGYAQQFYGYSTGMEFLNSVHAKFSGTFAQVNTPSQYASTFSDGKCSYDAYAGYDESSCGGAGGIWSDEIGCRFTDQTACQSVVKFNQDGTPVPGVWTVLQGGCATCHDVHQSTVAAVNSTKPFKNTCPDCHMNTAASAPQVTVAGTHHPSGPETPFGDLSDIPGACAKCHMPKPNGGAGRASHIWRISTDPSYTTFPSQSDWNGGQKTANTSADGTYANAVWIDTTMSCGPCHSVSKNDPANRPAKHYFDKEALATKAAGMHSGSTWSTDCESCHLNNGDPDAPQVQPGIDHHSAGCEGCHVNPGVLQFGIPIESCLSCHGPENAPTVTPDIQAVEQGVNHHSGNCLECHTTPGVPQFNTETSSCLSCHSVPQGTHQAVSYDTLNHPTYYSSTPNKCVNCHYEPGVAVSVLTVEHVCGQCHGGGTAINNPAYSPLAPGAPYKTTAILEAIAPSIHQSDLPLAVSHSGPVIGTSAFTGATRYSVSFTDTSTDPKGTPDTVTVYWGDGTVDYGIRGATFKHTYTRGMTYRINHSVYDGSKSDREMFTAKVPG